MKQTSPSQWPQRFSDKISIGEPDECWNWNATVIPGGYGQFWHEGRMKNSHRMALLFLGVAIPDRFVVMHSCDNRRCCNPRHLSVGLQARNIDDMVQKNRTAKGDKHGAAILSDLAVLAIRQRTETAAEAALKYGVSRAAINDIRQRLSWKHLP